MADYMILGHNFLGHMLSLPQYNSYFVEGLFKQADLPDSLRSRRRLLAAKSRLSWKLIHMLEGCQKFVWSWASFMERNSKELSAGIG